MFDDIGLLGRWVLSVLSHHTGKTVLEIRECIIAEYCRAPEASGIATCLGMLEGHGFVRSRERAVSRKEKGERAGLPLVEYLLTDAGLRRRRQARERPIPKVIQLRPRIA